MIGALLSSVSALVFAALAAISVWVGGPANYLFGLITDAWPEVNASLVEFQPYVEFVDAWVDLAKCFDAAASYFTFISVLITFKMIRSFLGI